LITLGVSREKRKSFEHSWISREVMSK
jgi:hypothetical protein